MHAHTNPAIMFKKPKGLMCLLLFVLVGFGVPLSMAGRAHTVDFNGSNPFTTPVIPTVSLLPGEPAGHAGWTSPLAVPPEVDPAAVNGAVWSQSDSVAGGSHILLTGLHDPAHSYGLAIDGTSHLAAGVSTFFSFSFNTATYRANFAAANATGYPLVSESSLLGVYEAQVVMDASGNWGLSDGVNSVSLTRPLLQNTWYQTDLKFEYIDGTSIQTSFELRDLDGNLLGSLSPGSVSVGSSIGCWYSVWQDNQNGGLPGETSRTYFDHVTLTGALCAVPEPVESALLGSLGLLGFGLWRRGRRR